MMAVRHFISILFISLVLISCQKSVDWTVTPANTDSIAGSGSTNNGGATGDLLVKVVVELNGDSLTTLYTYDAAKRLETETTKGSMIGIPLDMYKKFYRASNGRIYKVAQLIKDQQIQIDTAFTNVFYPNATSKNFTYTTNAITISGLGMLDSTVYTWNANGNITSHSSYASSNVLPGVTDSRSKTDYTYANGNLTQTKTYDELSPGGPLTLIATMNYTFDSNTNPLISDGEFVLTGKSENASKNNVTKIDFIDANDVTNNSTWTYAMTFGTGKKPTAGTVTLKPENQVFKYTFFYR